MPVGGGYFRANFASRLAHVLTTLAAMIFLLFLAVVAGFAFYVMKPEERDRVIKPTLLALQRLLRLLALAIIAGRRLWDALRARNRWALAGVGAVALVILATVANALYLRSLTDIKPEMQHLVAVEDRTSAAYQAAVEQFKLGAASADKLVRVIEKTVMPEITTAIARVGALERIPPEDQPTVEKAQEYLRLRATSWRLRVQALKKRSMVALRTADKAEHASLLAFESVKQSATVAYP